MFSRVKIKLSGVNSNTPSGDNYIGYKTGINDEYRDGKMITNYIWCIAEENYDFNKYKNEWENYTVMSEAFNLRNTSLFVLNYTNNNEFRISSEYGLCPLTSEGNRFSFYRREYQKIGKIGDEYPTIIKGAWEPVAINITSGRLRDFNITNGRSYQYIMYPNVGVQLQQFANANMEDGSANIYGDPVKIHWQDWSICELIPVKTDTNIPILKKSYKVDLNNIWLFKYSLETGAQTQNISKNEYKTLGQYSRFGYGQANALSGDVSCLLGSEIIPYTKDRYIERLWKGIDNPQYMSTNQKVDMLNKWRQLVYSKNPKLLRDMKGQSWIVQIVSSSNTPKNFYNNQPDSISFAWRQIDSVDGCIIYGDGDKISGTGDPGTVWYPWEKIQELK